MKKYGGSDDYEILMCQAIQNRYSDMVTRYKFKPDDKAIDDDKTNDDQLAVQLI